jgi:HlyD family secretion protein
VKKHLFIAVSTIVILGVVIALLFTGLPLVNRDRGAAQAMNQEVTDPPAAESPLQTGIVAEGVVVPARYATLSMAASGIVDQILAGEGTTVEAGQVILRLQNAHQQAAVAEAQAALTNAQAQYQALAAGARTQEVAAAQASLDAAQARLARLKEGPRPEDLAAGEAALAAARASLQRLYDGPDEQTRIAAKADLANAEAAVRQAQAAYDQVSGRAEIAMLPQSLQLQQATNAYEAAKARYDALFDDPDADLVANAQAQVKQAQANVDRLRKPATDNEIAEAEAAVRQVQAQLDLLTAGARPQEIDAAAAAVDQAKAALQQAQASLADTELRAPFAGTLAMLSVKEGEQVGAGVPIAQLADLTTWQVETDDLTELDIVNVHEGDLVTLTFDAIKDLELTGTVVRIKPLGVEKLGDVTYTVVIQPDEQDARLRWKMTAVATIP